MQLMKKLQSAETTIENLSHQVAGLQGTDSLTQARHQHEAVISSMQQRMDEQLLDLKQKLDLANEALTLKVSQFYHPSLAIRSTLSAWPSHKRSITFITLLLPLGPPCQRGHHTKGQSILSPFSCY